MCPSNCLWITGIESLSVTAITSSSFEISPNDAIFSNKTDACELGVPATEIESSEISISSSFQNEGITQPVASKYSDFSSGARMSARFETRYLQECSIFFEQLYANLLCQVR